MKPAKWKIVGDQEWFKKAVADRERMAKIAKAERRVVRAADSLVKVNLTGEFKNICNTCVGVERLIAAVSALHRARKVKK